jgi:pyridoxine kinase
MKITTSNIGVILNKLHQLGPRIVIITSVRDGGDIVLYGSSKIEEVVFEIRVPFKDCSFGGTGDLFTALLVAYLEKHGVLEACERAIDTIQAVLDHTVATRKQGCELAIVQSASLILNPPRLFKANVI